MSVLWPVPAFGAPPQDQDAWNAAVTNLTSSPSFVYATIVDDRTSESRAGCLNADFLRAAVMHKMNLAIDRSMPRAEQLKRLQQASQALMKDKDHVFHFADQGDLDETRFLYSSEELNDARSLVQAQKTEIETHKFSPPLPWQGGSRRRAFACALVEQGFRVQMLDINGQVVWNP